MCKVYGYCRISRKEQSIKRQIRNIKASYADAVIVEEAYTGTKFDGRKEFERLCCIVKPTDKIVFDSVSRMSRNAEEGFAQYQKFFEQGVTLEFLKEPHINSAVYKEAAEKQIVSPSTGDEATDELMQAITEGINRYMMRLAERQIRLAFEQAEKEVEDLRQRTSEGIETARLAGKQIGQQKGRKLNVRKAQPAKAQIRKYSKDFDGTLADVEVMQLTKLSRNTYYKYKREIKEQG